MVYVGWQSQRLAQGWSQMQHTQMATDWPQRVSRVGQRFTAHLSRVIGFTDPIYTCMCVYNIQYIYMYTLYHINGILTMATNQSLSWNVAKVHQEHWTKLASADKARRCFRTSQCPTILKFPLNLALRFSPYQWNTAWIKVLCCAHDSESP